MINIIDRNKVEKDLNIKFKNYQFDLKWTDYEDTSNIVTLCQNKCNILEIGTLYGHTTENIAKYNPTSNITTINITNQYYLNNINVNQKHELLDESESGKVIKSNNVVKLIIDSDSFFKVNNTKFDVILIDGDHSKPQVIKDTENALNHINKNGIIIWHDIYNKDNKCIKCLCEPESNDVREYLESLDIIVNKIERSWVGYYVSV